MEFQYGKGWAERERGDIIHFVVGFWRGRSGNIPFDVALRYGRGCIIHSLSGPPLHSAGSNGKL